MNRRFFLTSLIGGVAASAAVRTWPFRVYSFPSEVKELVLFDKPIPDLRRITITREELNASMEEFARGLDSFFFTDGKGTLEATEFEGHPAYLLHSANSSKLYRHDFTLVKP